MEAPSGSTGPDVAVAAGSASPAGRGPTESRRRLGDAWIGWDGARERTPARTNASPGLFLGIHLLLLAFSAAAWAGGVWLAQPRLLALGVSASALQGLRLAGFALLALPQLLLAGVWAGVPLPRPVARALEHWLVALWGPCVALGELLRLSRDRMGHAYLRITNRLTLLSGRARPGDPLVVLAPRCLNPVILRGLRALAEERGAAFVVATGGEEARAAVPVRGTSAVLAVACERDLVAGLREVMSRHTVLAIANRRPEGPCRNSEIDLPEAQRFLDRLARIVDRARG